MKQNQHVNFLRKGAQAHTTIVKGLIEILDEGLLPVECMRWDELTREQKLENLKEMASLLLTQTCGNRPDRAAECL
jgi:hypothetical protein